MCGGTWHGIIVEGDDHDQNVPNSMGSVELVNSAMIEFAHCGIASTLGGIIVANNSTFKDCMKAASFDSYTNTNPTYAEDNLSYFQGCNFICTGPLPDYNGNGTYDFVTLCGVHGVRFYGNTFENTGSSYTNNWRSCGIASLDAAYYVQPVFDQNNPGPCNNPLGDKNNFIGLSKGINYNFTVNSNSYRVFIRQNEFTNNNIGIIGTGGFNAQIYGNEFKLNTNFINDNYSLALKGIITNYSRGYNILNNNFEWTNTNSDLFVGIWSEEDGYDNPSLISQNTFRNISDINVRGNVVYSNCPQANINLQINCNTYKQNSANLVKDWYINIINCDGNFYTLTDQYSKFLNYVWWGAGNEFSYPMTCGLNDAYNIYNTAPAFVYHSVPSNIPSCIYGSIYIITENDDECTPRTVCDIYETPYPGHYILDMPEIDNGSGEIFRLIYSKAFDSARVLIHNLDRNTASDQNTVYLLNTVLSIYESNRDYSKMAETEKTILNNLTQNDDYAGSLSKSLLEFFDQRHFVDKPISKPGFEPKISQLENFSIPEILSNAMDIYPNPAQNSVFIYYSLAGNQKKVFIRIYDLLGKIIKEIPVNDNYGKLKIDKDELGASSYYNCVLTIDGKEIIHKAIILAE